MDRIANQSSPGLSLHEGGESATSVAVVLDRFDPLGGGLERWADQLCRHLVNARYEVHVVTFDVREPVNPALVVHRLPKTAGRLARAKSVEDLLRRLHVDVVHDLGVGWSFDVLHPHAGCKLANYRHDLRSRSRWERLKSRLSPAQMKSRKEMRELERRQYASGKGLFVAVSKMVQAHLQEYHHVDSSRVRLVYNGVDVGRFSPENRMVLRDQIRKSLGLGQQTLFLLIAANLRLKGLRTALQSMHLLKEDSRNAHLAVVGGGAIEPYRRLAERLNVAEDITFCGFREDPAPYYMAADVLIHPTFYDACSLVALEAWASGLPVITTRFNGAAELMTHGLHGFVIENPADAGELAMRMKSLLDPSLRSRMAEETHALTLNLSMGNSFQEIERIYKEICEA